MPVRHGRLLTCSRCGISEFVEDVDLENEHDEGLYIKPDDAYWELEVHGVACGRLVDLCPRCYEDWCDVRQRFVECFVKREIYETETD